MTHIDNATEIFQANSHLEDLAVSQLQDLSDACRGWTAMTGDALWSVGAEGTAAYCLVEGRVEVTWRTMPDGRESEEVAETGTLLALPYLVHGWEHESTAVPLERTDVLVLERPAFEELFDAHHPAAHRLVDAIAERLVSEVRGANRRLQDVFGHPAETLRTLRRRARESERD